MEKILSARPTITSQVCPQSQATRTRGTDPLCSSTQNIYASQAGQSSVTQACKENYIVKQQYSCSSRGQINQTSTLAKQVPNTGNVTSQISEHTPSKTVLENFNPSSTSTLPACPIPNYKTATGSILHNSHQSNQETPHQAHTLSGPSENNLSQPATARRLFPQFKPKMITSKIMNKAENQGPKITPVFSVQKKVNILPVTTERSALAASTSLVVPNSQTGVVQAGVIKTVPLFFKKSVIGKNSVAEKQLIVNQKQNGGKRAKSAAAGKEKTPKRSSKVL